MLVEHTSHKVLPVRSHLVHIILIAGIGIRGLRTGVNLIGERKHTLFYMEQALIVDAAVNGIPRALTVVVGNIAVQLVGGAGECGRRIGFPVTFVLAAPKAEGHGYQTQCIDFIAGFHAAGLESTVSFARSAIIQVGRTAVRFTDRTPVAAGIAARLVVIVVIVAGAESQFAALYRTEYAATGATVTYITAERGRIAFQTAAYGDNVQDTPNTLRIVLGAGIGNDFDMFDGVGGHTFQNIRRVIAHHIVGLAVDIYLETATAVHFDVIFTVYRYKGYFTQHLKNRVRFGIRVILYVILYLIDIGLYQRLLRHDFHLPQFVGSIRNVDSSEIHQFLSRFYGEVLYDAVPPHRRNRHDEVSFVTGHFLLKLSFHVRYQHLNGMCRRFFLYNPDSGIRLSFLS